MKIKKIISLSIATFILVLSIFGLCSCGDNTSNSPKIENTRPTFSQISNFKLDNLKKYENSAYQFHLFDDNDEVWVIIELEGKSLIEEYNDCKFVGSLAEFASTKDGENTINRLLTIQSRVKELLDENEIKYEFKHSYTTLLNGLGIKVRYKDIKTISSLAKVKEVAISELYNMPQEESSYDVALKETGILATSSNYKGEGMIVAILDTGLDTNHQAFQKPLTDVALTYQNIASISEYLYPNVANGGNYYQADQLYKSSKIPYGFDYADMDEFVDPGYMAVNYYGHGAHGTHVAGIIAGDDDQITGVAPNAQLAIMKVFSDNVPGAYTTDIIAALGDCALLGVDAINMSLGSANGFTSEGDGGEFIDEVYDLLGSVGINVCVAVGNDGEAGDGTIYGNGASSNPDNGLVGSPSSYDASFGVASSDAILKDYFVSANTNMTFNSAVFAATSESYPFYEALPFEKGSKTLSLPYVVVPNYGDIEDYEGLDVEGKIAVVSRGSTSFEYKSLVAAYYGAIACIIYNNEPGEIRASIEGELYIPTCTITVDSGSVLTKVKEGIIHFNMDNKIHEMSSFSSIGPLPNLELKPEITAPGGYIYSSVPTITQDENGNEISYAYFSGTSMASPNLAGAALLVRQALKENYPQMTETELQARVYQVLMSTANIIKDENGIPSTPRKQGSGLVNIDAALNTSAYLSVVGSDRAKLELGDDPSRDGIYYMSFDVVNTGTTKLSYNLDSIVMTDSVDDAGRILEKAYLLEASQRDYMVENGTYENGVLTVDANSVAKITVRIFLTDDDKAYLDNNFVNGMYVEGYITLDAVDHNIDLSIPWLAFYGDWDDAPIFDSTYYDETYEIYPTIPLGLYISGMLGYPFPLGSYELFVLPDGYEAPLASADKIALNYDGNNLLYSVAIGLLRSVKELRYEIVDKYTRQSYFNGYAINVGKTYLNDSGELVPTQHELNIEIPQFLVGSNQELEIVITGVLDTIDQKEESLVIPLTLDYEAPTLLDSKIYEEDGRTYLEFEAYDNHYLSYFGLLTESEAYPDEFELICDNAFPIYDETRGGSTIVTVDITDYKDKIYNNKLGLAIGDYALNENGYLIEAYTEFVTGSNITDDVQKVNYGETKTDKVVTTLNVNYMNSTPNQATTTDGVENTGEEFVIVAGTLYYYNGIGGEVVIPDGVTVVANDVFRKDNNITKIVFPEGITTIGSGVARAAMSLEEVIFPTTLETIGDEAFALCYALEKADLSTTNLKSLGFMTFSYCISLKEVTLPETPNDGDDNMTYLKMGYESFTHLHSLEKLMVYANIEYMANSFSDVPALKEANFYGYLGNVNEFTLSAAKELTVLNFYGDVGQLGETTIDDWGFMVMREDSATLADLPKLKEVNFYGNVDTIGGFAFSMCPLLENVIFHKNLNKIEAYVSADSTKLLKYTASDDNEYLINGDCGVMYNKEMTKLFTPSCWDYNGEYVLPETIVELSESAFGQAEAAIRSVNIVSSFTEEGVQTNINKSYGTCKLEKPLLKKITLHDKITEFPIAMMFGLTNADLEYSGIITNIGRRALNNTGVRELVFTDDLLTIGAYAFGSCDKLTKVVLPDNVEFVNEEGSVSEDAFNYMFTECKALKEFRIPSTITTLYYGAFEGCSSLETVDLNNVTMISQGSNSFKDCINLKNIIGIENVEYIGEGAFMNCTSLKMLDLGNCYEIGKDAFNNCTSIENIVLSTNLTTLGSFAFANCTSLEEVVIPEGVEGIDVTSSFVGCTGLVNFEIHNGDYDSFDGIVYTKDLSELVLFPAGKLLDTYKVLEQTTRIGDYAFASNKYLINIDLANVEEIGNNSFESANIVTVKSTNLKYVYPQAFKDTINLVYIDLDMIEELGFKAFENTGLEEVIMSNNLMYIEEQVFANCDNLRKVVISNNCCNFDYSNIFYQSFNIEEIIVEDFNKYYLYENGVLYNSTKTVLYAYRDSSNSEFIIPEGVEKIALNAFYQNTILERVVLPSTLKAIGDKAFYGCTSLKELVFLSDKAPALEGLYQEGIYYPYANFVDYIELVPESGLEITIYYNGDESYQTIIWQSYFKNYEVIA